MNNNELEDILKTRFGELRSPLPRPSIVGEVMSRVDAGAAELSLQLAQPIRGWVLVFAMLMGALVCLPSLQSFELQAFDFSAFTNAFVSPFTQHAGAWLNWLATHNDSISPGLFVAAGGLLLLPLLFLLLEE